MLDRVDIHVERILLDRRRTRVAGTQRGDDVLGLRNAELAQADALGEQRSKLCLLPRGCHQQHRAAAGQAVLGEAGGRLLEEARDRPVSARTSCGP